MKNIICSTALLLLISLSSTGAAFCVQNTTKNKTVEARGGGGITVWYSKTGPRETKCCPETKFYCKSITSISINKTPDGIRLCDTNIKRKEHKLMVYTGYSKTEKKWVCKSGK